MYNMYNIIISQCTQVHSYICTLYRHSVQLYSITVYTGSFRVHTPSSFTTFLKIQFVQQYTITVYTGSFIHMYFKSFATLYNRHNVQLYKTTVHMFIPGTYSQHFYNIIQ